MFFCLLHFYWQKSSTQSEVLWCLSWRRNGTLYLLKPLRCLFKLHVFCDLPLRKDLAFKHLYVPKMSPRQVPSDSGYFCIRHSLMIPLDTGIWGCLNDILVILLCTSIILTSILRKILHFFLKRQILVRFIPNWIASILDIFACISKLYLIFVALGAFYSLLLDVIRFNFMQFLINIDSEASFFFKIN